MCGIAGEIVWREDGSVELAAVPRIASLLAHRGPDDWAYWHDDARRTLLIHTRLAILDLSGGRQPLCNEDGTIWAAVNGELYEYERHAAELRARGHVLRTRCDSELVVHLYEEHGAGLTAHLRGEFAFVLHDARRGETLLVRDRFGIKPLYVQELPGRLRFASEIKALLGFSNAGARLDERAVYSIISGIIPPDRSIFQGIAPVAPGSIVRVASGRVTRLRYWSPRFASEAEERARRPVSERGPETAGAPPAASAPDRKEGAADEREAVAEFRARLTEAIRLRLQSDVEVATYLSGGIDSSAIACLLAPMTPHKLKAFTVGFENPAFDESEAAAAVARHVGLEHHIIRIGPGELARHFERSLWHHEVPVMNAHGAAKFMLSSLAGSMVKVVVTGEGADELLLGYPQFRHQHLIEQARRRPGDAAARGALDEFLRNQSVQFGVARRREYVDEAAVVRRFGAYPYPVLRAIGFGGIRAVAFDRHFRQRVQAFDPLESLAEALPPGALAGLPNLRATQHVLLRTDMAGYILAVLGDRSEMGHSVEGRVPFLDHELFEYVATVPLDLLTRGDCGKWLLRQAVRELLPPELLERRKKIFLSPSPEVLGLFGRSELLDQYLSPRAARDVGVIHPWAPALVRGAMRWLPRGSYFYGLLEGALIFALSLHILHRMFCTSFRSFAERFAPEREDLTTIEAHRVVAPLPAALIG